MKKYLFIFKSELMSNLQYVFNMFVSFITYIIMIYIFLNLWKYIYSDSSELINGYNVNQMIWYVIVTEIIWCSLRGKKLCKKLSEDVRSGNVIYNINKPYSYIGYIIADHLGKIAVIFLLYLILGNICGFLFLHTMPSIPLFGVVLFVISCSLAIIISTIIATLFGLFSFVVEDSSPFYWIYSKFILIVGTLFPIEYFPSAIQPILKFSPVFAIVYGPAKMYVDFSYELAFTVILSQIVYIIVSYLICSLIYKKGVEKLNVNGG